MFRTCVPLLLAFSCLTSAAIQPPKLRLSEVQDITLEKYRVDLALDPQKEQFAGTIQIQLKVNRPTSTIWLNANRITVGNATVKAGGKSFSATTLPGGDDYLGLKLEADLPAGNAEITIRYTGAVRKGETAGVFLAEDQGNRYIYTQFEATDARDAFPCFDEPSYKVPWQLTLRVPGQLQAVSNTLPISEKTEGGTRTIVFRETKPLPSYLVAFTVGPLEFVEAGAAGKQRVPVRIVVPKGHRAEAKYAAEVSATILTRLEDYFGIPFPYEKSDQVAVPVRAFGAMENPGMVVYAQTLLLSRPESDTIPRQRAYAMVVAHELSHQWFGDLATTAWWNDIWLNEAFATWMEQKLIAEWKPEWNTPVANVESKLNAQNQDSLMTARKIRQEIESKGDIANAFDDITYNKGAAVIGMFESWMGPEVFRKGVQAYLRQYSFRAATSGEFLDSLSSASTKDITRSFSTFLNQPGVPVVSAALDCSNQPGRQPALHLEQSRYLPIGSKGTTDQTWNIPICIRYGGGPGESECTLMTQAKMDWPLHAKTCPAWVEVNDKAKGYYRVEYRGGLLASLTSGDVQHRLNDAERRDLIGNAGAMASGGKMSMGSALQLAETFHADPSRQVVEGALSLALSIDRDVVPQSLRPNYERFIRKDYQERARQLGWTPQPGESEDVRLLRPTLVGAVARTGGDQELAKQARELAERWLNDRKAVHPDVVLAILQTAAYYGDLPFFGRLLAEFEKTQDRQEQGRLLRAMLTFRDPAAIQAGMREVVSGGVKLIDGFSLILGAGQASRTTAKMPFEFVKAHFEEIVKGNPSIFGSSLGSLLPNAGDGLCDAESRKELAAYFTPLAGKYDGAPRNLAQALERVDLCIARSAAQTSSVAEFLARY